MKTKKPVSIGTVQAVDIQDEVRSAYLDYAMSVIVARALPDSRDGLKPVHRRILYAMHDMGIRSSSRHKKSARIVGEVLGKYHPHGDQAVYDAMSRMAQGFAMRYTLVDGQGNFGSIDGDAPAAMRYTEARLTPTAEEMLLDIEKGTVNWSDNFDSSLQEPEVLPARWPNLLLNGASGIAVGMATNIPPHNLNELANAICYLIDRTDILATIEEANDEATGRLMENFGLSEEQAQEITQIIVRGEEEPGNTSAGNDENVYHNSEESTEASVQELMVFVKGPDFPTGGIVVGSSGSVAAYSTGKGRVALRGVAQIEQLSGGRHRIVITEIPYQVNKTNLIERIAELVRSGRITMVSDLRDESDRTGMRIVLDLKLDAQPKKVRNQLYKYTTMQSTFGVQLLALVSSPDGGHVEPRLLSLRRSLQIYIDHRQEIITRRSQYQLDKARARAHVLAGLLIAIANIEEVVDIIRKARDADLARQNLMRSFDLDDVQARAILDLQLRRLAALERLQIEQENKEVLQKIEYLEDLLAHPKKILALIKDDLGELVDKYGDDRRTRIAYDVNEELGIEDMVADEYDLIMITSRGYIKRMNPKSFRAQHRGGKGMIGQGLRDEEEVDIMFSVRSLQTILFFTDVGKVYSAKAYEIPSGGRTDKGISPHNVLSLGSGERITAAVPVPSFADADFCTMVTRRGIIKRVALSKFESVRPSGLIAISLREGDELGWVRVTLSGEELLIITAQGQALRFSTELVRSMGRSAAGVKGINLREGDSVTGVEVVKDENNQLLVVTSGGYGKRTSMSAYPAKGRGTGGVTTLARRLLSKTGPIVAARRVMPEDHITIVTTNGQALRTTVANVPHLGRATMGSRLIRLRESDTVASVARLADFEIEAKS